MKWRGYGAMITCLESLCSQAGNGKKGGVVVDDVMNRADASRGGSYRRGQDR